MQESNPHSKTDIDNKIEANHFTTCATETLASMYKFITGELVQDRQLNKTTIVVLKPNKKIQSSKYRPKKSPVFG